MGAAVMKRCDLDVLDVAAAVRPLVFKAQIRKVDVPVNILDVSEVSARLKWKADTDFETGLTETWRWVQEKISSKPLYQ